MSSEPSQSAVSEIFDPSEWAPVEGFDLTDITYHRRRPVAGRPRAESGVVRIAFDRPEVLNAFRPHTVDELYRALDHARRTPDVGVVLLTGNGPSPQGRQVGLLLRRRPAHPRALRLPVRRGRDRRHRRRGAASRPQGGRLHILEVQRLIRTMPKVVIAVVAGLGGRRRALAARRLRPDHRQPRARPLQADRRRRRLVRRRLRQRLPRQDGRPEVRPRDLLPRPHVLRRGHARMGAVNIVADHADLEREALQVATRDHGQEPAGPADAEVRLQPRSTTA